MARDTGSSKGNALYSHPKRGEPNPYQHEHVELFEAITRGEHKFMDAEYGAYSTLAGIIGRLATYSGQVTKWEDALNFEIDLMPERLAWDALPKVLPDEEGHYPYAIPGQTVVV